MSRKIRTPKGRTEPLPSPAWTFFLLTGTSPKCRLPGWVSLAQVPLAELEGHLRTTWAAHREALEHEATAAGFTPWALTCGARPCGPAVQRWTETFIREHRY